MNDAEQIFVVRQYRLRDLFSCFRHAGTVGIVRRGVFVKIVIPNLQKRVRIDADTEFFRDLFVLFAENVKILIIFHSVAERFQAKRRNESICVHFPIFLSSLINERSVAGRPLVTNINVFKHVSRVCIRVSTLRVLFVFFVYRHIPIQKSVDTVIVGHNSGYSCRNLIIVYMQRGHGIDGEIAGIPPHFKTFFVLFRNLVFRCGIRFYAPINTIGK